MFDTQGKPAASVYVEGQIAGADRGNQLARRRPRAPHGADDAKGEFAMAPLPPGQYEVTPGELRATARTTKARETRPLPGVSVRKQLTLKAGEPTRAVEVRAVPHVVIEAQYYDGKGKPTRGHAGHMFGQVDKNNTGSARPRSTERKMTLLAPHGLDGGQLSLMTNEHGALRWRTARACSATRSRSRTGTCISRRGTRRCGSRSSPR